MSATTERDVTATIPQQFRAYRRRPIEERFWEKVKKTDGCWLWLAALDSNGYGQFSVGRRAMVRAHRVSYLLRVGPIEKGLQIDHLCRNRRCVNPAHLEAVSQAENTARGTSVGAVARRTNRCMRGHAFTPDNTHIRPDTGHRFCRACIAIREERRRAQRAL